MEVTHAKIRFIDDNFKTVVPIEKIAEYKTKLPKNINDFDRHKIYSCLWKDKKNPVDVKLGVQIAELAIINNEEELKAFDEKRATLPTLHISEIDEYNNACSDENSFEEQEPKKDPKNKQKLIEKKAAAAEVKVQRDILLNKIANFTSSSQLQPSSSKCNSALNNNCDLEALDMNINNDCCKKILEKYQYEMKMNTKIMKENESLKESIETLRTINDYLQKELFINQRVKLSWKDNNTVTNPIVENEHLTDNKKIDATPRNRSLPRKISTPQGTYTQHNETILSNISTPPNTDILSVAKTSTPIFPEYAKDHINDENLSSGMLNVTPIENKENDLQKSKTNCRKRLLDVNPLESSNSNLGIACLDDTNLDTVQEEKRQKLNNTDNKKAVNKKYKEATDQKPKDISCLDDNNGKHVPHEKRQLKDDDSKKTVENKYKEPTEPKPMDIPLQEEAKNKFGDKWTKMEENKKVKMIYLSNNFSLKESTWKTLKEGTKPSIFTKKLFRELYNNDPQVISRKSVSGDPNLKTPNKINSRTKISPEKDSVITKCLRYYLSKPPHNLSNEALKKAVEKRNHYISEDITATIKKLGKKD